MVVKFSVYLNRRVFVMIIRAPMKRNLLKMEICLWNSGRFGSIPVQPWVVSGHISFRCVSCWFRSSSFFFFFFFGRVSSNKKAGSFRLLHIFR